MDKKVGVIRKNNDLAVLVIKYFIYFDSDNGRKMFVDAPKYSVN